jgi:hypothetical protein
VDFAGDGGAFGVVGFTEIVLGLELDEEIPGDAEAGLKAQGNGGADAFALAYDIAELGGADVHGSGGIYLGDVVMFQRVPNEGGGGVGNGLWDFGGVPWNSGWLEFHFWLVSFWIQWVSWILTSWTFFSSAFSHWKVMRQGDVRESASME